MPGFLYAGASFQQGVRNAHRNYDGFLSQQNMGLSAWQEGKGMNTIHAQVLFVTLNIHNSDRIVSIPSILGEEKVPREACHCKLNAF